MQEKDDIPTPSFFYGDNVFKDVMQSLLDKPWIAEWEKLDVRVKNRKSADLEEFRLGIKELSSLYNSVWLKNVIKKCCGDLFDSLKVLLEKLYEDRIDWKFGETNFNELRKKAIAKRQYLPILLFGLLPKLKPELQREILLFMIDCVNERVHNVEIFFEMDILRKLIFMLMSIHKCNVFDLQNPEEIPQFDIQLSDDSIKIIYDFICTLASHNVRPQDLKTMLLPFRLGTFANESEEQKEGVFRSSDYLSTLLRIAQSTENPPSFFSWSEPAGGLFVYPSQAWPKNGYTLFGWIRFENYPSYTSSLPIFHVRGLNDRTMELCLKNQSLFLKYNLDKEVVEKIIPLEGLKLNSWYWIAIAHVKKSMRRSVVSVYCNEKCIFEDKINYPETLDGGNKSSYQISFAKQMDGSKPLDGNDYRFQMCSMGFMGIACTEQDANALYQLHNSPSYSLNESTTSDEWKEKQDYFLKNCICYYEARNTRDTLCYDCCGNNNATMSEGTRIVSENTLTSTLASLGGVPVILPMFVPSSSTVSIQHLPMLVPQPLSAKAYSQALSLLVILLQEDQSQITTFKNNGGVQLLSILLRRCPSNHLTMELVTVIHQIVEALQSDNELYIAAVRYLLFDFSIWGSAPWSSHVVILRILGDFIHANTSFVKSHVGLRPLLQALVKIYYTDLSIYSCKRDESFTEDLVADLQQSIIEMIKELVNCDTMVYRVDISYILSVLYMISDVDIIQSLLDFLYELMTSRSVVNLILCIASAKTNLFQSLCLCHAHTVFLKCMCHEIEDIRITAIRCLQCFWMNTSPASKLNAGINEFTLDECSGIAEFIGYNLMTIPIYQCLMDFALGLKPESVSKGVVDGRRPLAIQFPFMFNVLIESLCSAKDAVRDLALSHILNLVEGVPSATSNRLIIAQSSTALYSLLILYITTQTETTRNKAKQILVDCIVSYIISRDGGWEILEQLRIFVDSMIEHPKSNKEFTVPSHFAISFDACYASLVNDIMILLKNFVSSNKPKRKDPTGSMFYESYAMSTYLVMCYCLGITPPSPRAIDATNEDAIISIHPTDLIEVNQIDINRIQLLVTAVDFWQDLIPQLTSPTDNCLSDSSKHTNTPLMEKGIVPVLLKALQAVLLFSMKQLFEQKQAISTVAASISKYCSMLDNLLYSTTILTKIKGNEVLTPKNDWCNQLLFNTSIILFSLISVCKRVTLSFNPASFTTQKEANEYKKTWDELENKLWSLLSVSLRNIRLMLITIDEAAFSVLSNLDSVNPQNMQTIESWAKLFCHEVFVKAVEGMKFLLVSYRDQLISYSDKRIVELYNRLERCRSDNSPLTTRLKGEMRESTDTFVESFEKEASFSIIERETNGLKIMKKLWRELVLGPSMWHGVETVGETTRVYYQLDRKETVKRLRNRLKRDWHERPHRHIGRDLTGMKQKEEEQKMMNIKLYKIQNDNERLPVDGEEVSTPSSPIPYDIEEEVNNLDLKYTHGERVIYSTRMELVLPMCVVQGKSDITPTSVYFYPESFAEGHEGDKKEMHVRHWDLNSITEVYRRRYLLAPTGIEIVENNKSYFWNFPESGEYNRVFQIIMLQKPKHLRSHPLFKHLYSPSQLVAKSEWTQLWRTRQISNFEYLMKLNMASGRTYNDIQQYPVFPWVISDYTSEVLDLDKPEVYRDLSKPIGALDEERLEGFMERYNAMDDGDIPKFMYGSHYSNVGTVLNFLVRMEPFAELAAKLQGGHFDWADRLFHSIEEAWVRVLTSTGDLKELTPEFFYSPHFLRNMNGLDLGKRQDGTVLDDVILPPWASSPEEFIRINMQALESDYVSEHLSDWIDLIWGYKQRGEEAEKAYNVFYYLTYEGMVDTENITDPNERKAIEAQIANFGQTPSQLFTTPHPKRYTVAEALNTLGLKILPGTVLNPQYVDTKHGTSIIKLQYNKDEKEIMSVDMNGSFCQHKYYASQPGHKLFPFTLQASDKAGTRLLPTCNTYPTSIRNRVIHERTSTVSDDVSFALMRQRFCVDPSFKYLFATGCHDCAVRILSLSTGEEIAKLSYNRLMGSCIALSDDCNDIVVGTRDGLLVVWDIEENDDEKFSFRLPRLILPGLPSKVTQIIASRDLDLLVASTADNLIYLFNLRDGHFVQVINLHEHLPSPLNQEGKTVKNNYRITQILTTWTGYVLVSVSSLDTKLNNYLFCFDLNGNKLYSRDDVCRIHTMISSSDSKWIFAESVNNICIFTLPDLRLNTVLSSQTRIQSICVSADNRALFAGAEDGKILCYGLNLRWKEKEEMMPQRSNEDVIGNSEDLE